MDYGIDYSILPEHMQGAARLYIEEGIITGSFLTAVMENNLVEAFARADQINFRHMGEWAYFLCYEAPTVCWGSPEKVKAWKEKGGINGLTAEARHRASGDPAQAVKN